MEGYSSLVELPCMKSMVQSQYTHTHIHVFAKKKITILKFALSLAEVFTTLTSPSYWGLHCNPGFTSNGLSGPPYRDYPTPVPPPTPPQHMPAASSSYYLWRKSSQCLYWCVCNDSKPTLHVPTRGEPHPA